MPFVPTTRATTTQLISVGLPEFEAPLPHRFIAHNDPSPGEKFLNITKTEREAEIQPDSVTNNLRRETEPFVIGSRSVCFHAISMPEISLLCKLTIPFWACRREAGRCSAGV